MNESRLFKPCAGVDDPATFGQFQDWFATDGACFDCLAKLRWPVGFVCPACSGRLFRRTSSKLWMCQSCSRGTSVIAGTIFESTRSPLRTWFAAVWFAMAQKNGVSALVLQRVLGLKSYETGWAWMHKLRRGMVVPDRDVLSGVVEVDETYVGGIRRGNAGRSSDKIGAMVAAEMVTARKLGRVRLQPTPGGELTLIQFT